MTKYHLPRRELTEWRFIKSFSELTSELGITIGEGGIILARLKYMEKLLKEKHDIDLMDMLENHWGLFDNEVRRQTIFSLASLNDENTMNFNALAKDVKEKVAKKTEKRILRSDTGLTHHFKVLKRAGLIDGANAEYKLTPNGKIIHKILTIFEKKGEIDIEK